MRAHDRRRTQPLQRSMLVFVTSGVISAVSYIIQPTTDYGPAIAPPCSSSVVPVFTPSTPPLVADAVVF